MLALARKVNGNAPSQHVSFKAKLQEVPQVPQVPFKLRLKSQQIDAYLLHIE